MSAPALSPEDRAILIETHDILRACVQKMQTRYPDDGRRPEGRRETTWNRSSMD